MEFLILFDEQGYKISGKMQDINYKTLEERQALLDAGYMVISEEDFDKYCDQTGGENGRGYVRDPETGKPVSAPAYEPSIEEQATVLFNECQADLKEIDAQIVNAIIIKDTELVEELRQEREERIAEYEAALEELKGGE